MGGGHGMPEMRARMMEIVETFNAKGATSPESALTLEELGLPPMFGMMMQSPMGQSGIFVENDGKYYLNEEQFKQMQARFGPR